MIRYNHLEHRFVNEIPEALEPGVLYASMHYATAMHLCCCGCGREIVTPLSPAQWKLTFDGDSISLHPSIGSWALPCRSHYFIYKNQVVEAASWSKKEVVYGQTQDKHARTAYFEAKADVDPKTEKVKTNKEGWLAKLHNQVIKIFS